MRPLLTLHLLIVLLIGGLKYARAQSPKLVPYRDAVNHYEIRLPKGWFFGMDKDEEGDPTGKLALFRHDSTDHPFENFVLDIGKRPHSSAFREERLVIDSLRSAGGFELQEEDSLTMNGQRWIWFVAKTPQNTLVHLRIPTISYVFITYKAGKTYSLSFQALPESFSTYRMLYDEIAHSLILR